MSPLSAQVACVRAHVRAAIRVEICTVHRAVRLPIDSHAKLALRAIKGATEITLPPRTAATLRRTRPSLRQRKRLPSVRSGAVHAAAAVRMTLAYAVDRTTIQPATVLRRGVSAGHCCEHERTETGTASTHYCLISDLSVITQGTTAACTRQISEACME